jgi:hypothetical protein
MLHNRKIGVLAMENEWLSEEGKNKILVLQEESRKKFGAIATEEKYLTKSQLKELLKKQNADYLFLGGALVKLGVISEDELNKNLKEFEKIKIKKKK